MGVGRSKKEAKHAAAKALIDKLTGMNISDQFYQQKGSFNANGSATAQSNPNAAFDENSQMGNPIGVLQELCMQKHWPAPKYEVEVYFFNSSHLLIFLLKFEKKNHFISG